MNTFAERLRFAMHKKNMKQSVLSYKTKIDKSYISNYLSGKYEPKQDKIQLIAKALSVSEAWLSGYSTEENEDVYKPKGIKIPVLGCVAAGVPIEAITDILDYEEIDADMIKDGSEYFALSIKGQSMEPKFSEGDVVIVRKQPDVDSGQIAIVCVNGDTATCKKVMKQSGGILLQPLNPAYDPVFYSAEEIYNIPITILGRVVELRAKF